MIRIALIAGAAAVLVAKKLRQGKSGRKDNLTPTLKPQQNACKEGNVCVKEPALLEGTGVSRKTPALKAAKLTTIKVIEGLEEKTLRRYESGNPVESAEQESPKDAGGIIKGRLDRTTFVADGEPEHVGPKRAETASVLNARRRISNLRLEIEQSFSQQSKNEILKAQNREEKTKGQNKGENNKGQNGLESINAQDGGENVKAHFGGETIKAPPTPLKVLENDVSTPVRERVSSLPIDRDGSPLDNELHGPLLLHSSSIRAPPTPSNELLEGQGSVPPQAPLSLRGVPTIPPRSRSRGPRVSTTAGLLDILPDERRISASPPARSSFAEGVLTAFPKVGLHLSSRSGGSTPVGSIRAPPTPLAVTPDLATPQGSPVIRAVPTTQTGGVSLDHKEEIESEHSLGTTPEDGASVVMSPIKTKREERVAQERMSLKDRWEAQRANGGDPNLEASIAAENGHVEKGRQSPMETYSDMKESASLKGSRQGLQALNGSRSHQIEAQLEVRERALHEIEAQETVRREGLRVLEEREQELKRRVADLEKALEARRDADMAKRADIRGTGSDQSGFDQARFDLWCKLRTGSTDKTVHWYSTGELFSYPGGQLLARLEGFEAVRARREGAETVHELSRRLLVVVDKERGSKLDVVRTAYQQCTYRLEGTAVHTEVTIGSESNSIKLSGTAGGVRVMRGSGEVAFTRPLFMSIPSDKGDFVAFENHDFFTSLDSEKGDHFSMVRLGPVPGFQGTCFVHVIGQKLSDLAGLPAVLRDELEKEPLWKEAPEKVYF